jgi:hypothetical protein
LKKLPFCVIIDTEKVYDLLILRKETTMIYRNLSQELRRGLGGAIVELKNAKDKSAYHDILLRCCFRDISYDWQVEGTKGFYLYQAICALDEKDEFEEIIIGKFLSRCYNRLFCQLAGFFLVMRVMAADLPKMHFARNMNTSWLKMPD